MASWHPMSHPDTELIRIVWVVRGNTKHKWQEERREEREKRTRGQEQAEQAECRKKRKETKRNERNKRKERKQDKMIRLRTKEDNEGMKSWSLAKSPRRSSDLPHPSPKENRENGLKVDPKKEEKTADTNQFKSTKFLAEIVSYRFITSLFRKPASSEVSHWPSIFWVFSPTSASSPRAIAMASSPHHSGLFVLPRVGEFGIDSEGSIASNPAMRQAKVALLHLAGKWMGNGMGNGKWDEKQKPT